MSTEKAADLIEELKTADSARAQEVWDAEAAKPEQEQRTTVLAAAEGRVAELEPLEATGGEPASEVPDGEPWAMLLDGDGEPVLVDGEHVAVELTP